MAQILDPLPSNSDGQILCCYVNATSQIQIARISNIPNWYFERVVFPGQRLIFEALPEALLEIHTGMMASSVLSDTIPCERLQMNHGPFSTICPAQNLKRASASQPKPEKKAEPALSAVD